MSKLTPWRVGPVSLEAFTGMRVVAHGRFRFLGYVMEESNVPTPDSKSTPSRKTQRLKVTVPAFVAIYKHDAFPTGCKCKAYTVLSR
jgi:hypothetical protein